MEITSLGFFFVFQSGPKKIHQCIFHLLFNFTWPLTRKVCFVSCYFCCTKAWKYYSINSPGEYLPAPHVNIANCKHQQSAAEFQRHKVRLRGVIYVDAGNAFNFIAFGVRKL